MGRADDIVKQLTSLKPDKEILIYFYKATKDWVALYKHSGAQVEQFSTEAKADRWAKEQGEQGQLLTKLNKDGKPQYSYKGGKRRG